MPPRDRLPKFFLDRSLGRVAVPAALRVDGWEVVIEAVVKYKAKCFVITRGQLTSDDMSRRFIANKQAIYRATELPGPYIYSVQQDRLDRLFPKEPVTQEHSRLS